MSINSLDDIIRKVSKNVSVSDRTQKRLIVERKQQTLSILKKEPLLASMFGSQLEYYIIASGDRTTNVSAGQLSSTIKDASTNKSLDVVIHYEASCLEGQEEKVLHGLCSSIRPPERELANTIEKCVATYNRRSGWQFFEDYAEAVVQLQETLSKDVEQATGLYFRPWISLPQTDQLVPFVIQPIVFGVSVQQCNDKLALQLSAELAVDKANKGIAVLKIGREFELANVVKSGVRRYLREQVSLHSFYTDLSGSIQREVAAYLAVPLAEYGRKVKRLSLTVMATVPENTQLETVSCRVRCQLNKPKPIEFDVCSVLGMQLVDVGKYRREQVLTLNDWVQEKLSQKMLRSALFGKSYLDVVLGFDAIAATLKRKMTVAASEIGYTLHTIDIQPELEPFRLAQPFDLVLKNKRFQLGRGNTTAPLDVTLRLYLSNLDAIANRLSPDVLLEPLIAETAVDEINAVLSSATPDTFDRWLAAAETIDLDNRADAFTVEDALMPCLQEVLGSQYKAVVESITIIASEDESV